MRLTVRDAAVLLNVTEKTIYRWIEQGAVPARQVNDQYRFNRAELLEWATARKLSVSPDIFAESEGENAPPPSLSEALSAGGIYHGVAGQDKGSALRAVVDTMKVPEEVDREFLYQVLLAREALGSTGIGEGIAIPHVRNPIVLHVTRPLVTLCFLDRAVDFGAVDGQAVWALFTLISPTVRVHLHLLSRLGFALRDANFKSAITSRAPSEHILDALKRVEAEMGSPGTLKIASEAAHRASD